MRRLKILIFFSCLLFILYNGSALLSVSEDYLKLANDSLSYLEIGKSNESVSTLRQMNKYFGKDDFITAAYAVNLLVSGHEKESEKIFTDLLSDGSTQKTQLANYCMGILMARQNKYQTAIDYFTKNKSDIPNYKSLICYIKTMADANFIDEDLTEDSLLSMELYAYWNMLRNKNPEALTNLNMICNIKGLDVYKDTKGILYSYDASNTLMFNAYDISGRLGLDVDEKRANYSLTGTTTIKADISKSNDIQTVAIYVDGNMRGITNSYPYSFSLNTADYINGIHQIKINALNSAGDIINSKNFTIEVFNERPDTSLNADFLWTRLWDYVQIKQGMETVNYLLAVCAAREKNLELHRLALERCVSVNPEYRDASHLLRKYYFKSNGKQLIEIGNIKKKQIAITFDDGPTLATHENLEILKKFNAKATFFIVGRMAEKNPDVLKEIASGGHQIAIHSQNHPDYTKLSYKDIVRETFQCYSAIKSLGVTPSIYFRPPGGNHDGGVAQLSKDYGFKIALWTKNTTHLQESTPELLSQFCIDSVKPGNIYLMHNNEAAVTESLPTFLKYLREKGYECVTLDEIIKEN